MSGYTAFDEERYFPEEHTSSRTNFARDRARIVHSSALRRLSAKTQVLSPATAIDFARNRLTHTLEVAQVGRELGTALELNPDIVDAACLAHDLGHPPFGHNGETALNEWAKDFGGFEGNAQSLRLLTRLEPKVFNSEGESFGLNLTRAVLDASVKYPWTFEDAVPDAAAGGRNKFGVYADDIPIFSWLREGIDTKLTSIETQVMDLSDDIAYSVHDFEDAIFGGFLRPEHYNNLADDQQLLQKIAAWSGNRFSVDEFAEASDRLTRLSNWITSWSSTPEDQGKLKNLTSQLIGRFVQGTIDSTRRHHEMPVVRYHGSVIIPEPLQHEIELLKGIVAVFVMQQENRQPVYERQRILLTGLLDFLKDKGPDFLDRSFQVMFENATTEEAKMRILVDQVASLTDQSATRMARQLGIIESWQD